MEHEVYVPLSLGAVRGAFADPGLVARCVPGLQPEPGGDPAAPTGRLRLRIGSSTITYRGSAVLAPEGDGLRVEARGEEARGSGSARVALRVVARPVPDGAGTTLAFSGSAEGTGRLGDAFTPEQRATAARRLFDRFAETLTEELARVAEPPPVAGGIGEPGDNERVIPGIPAAPEPEAAAAAAAGQESQDPAGEEAPSRRGPRPAAHGAEEPAGEAVAEEDLSREGLAGDELAPEDLVAGDLAEDLAGDVAGDLAGDLAGEFPGEGLPGEEAGGEPGAGGGAFAGGEGEFPGEFLADELAGELAEEAAEEGLVAEGLEVEELATAGADDPEPEADFARRTMIGRSAEEVDHAPPRGRYAPEPAPGRSPGSPAALRWAAPAAALALASAVVLGRVLRRRRS
ncbi:carbon monoxide dehydrogenase [Streptomyces hoynatensis]|uniref:Carbon monoxide dehydrogenase n=2 Tax=Streptomyces hoynatensis TaxID=1141874 RepID=A0A3A9YK53_9ACTN|nr:carbon monoxide dehydrogenase [Streptomyces hoynatensis]